MSSYEYEDGILDGMARALWVTSYADFVKELRAEGHSRRQIEEMGFATAGPSDDWSDVAPATPTDGRNAALALRDAIETANDGATLSDLLERAAAAETVDPGDLDAELFGHYLAMEALGHGVSWTDDHADYEVEFPFFEAHFDGDALSWSRAHMNPEMTARERKSLRPSQFAFPKKRKLPIPDASHVRNAMARFDQVEGVTKAERRRAYQKILGAAARFGIDASGFERKVGRAL